MPGSYRRPRRRPGRNTHAPTPERGKAPGQGAPLSVCPVHRTPSYLGYAAARAALRATAGPAGQRAYECDATPGAGLWHLPTATAGEGT